MADFLESFKKGIEAAKVAEKNRAEIDFVFEALNKQLAEGTEGKIAIDTRPMPSRNLLLFDFLKPLVTHEAIAAYNPQVSESPV